MSTPLRIEALTVQVRDGLAERTLLDAVDLSVDAGTMTALSGRSGSGKTTLLTIAGLLRRPPSGDVEVVGTSTGRLSDRRRATLRRDHVAFVFQSANLLPSLTAIEQLELVGRIRGERPRETRRRAAELLDQLGLGDGAQQRLPRELSGGERQRVGVARALIATPDVLIADEPTASLDADRGREIAALLARETHERGLATLLVSHDEVPLTFADRHLRLANGSLELAPLPVG